MFKEKKIISIFLWPLVSSSRIQIDFFCNLIPPTNRDEM